VVVLLSEAGIARIPVAGPARVVLSSEDAAFAPDAMPPMVQAEPDGTTIRFHRAGAVILKA
jgi:hypothetical protein